MADLHALNRNKERILYSIRMNGPSLPVQIAKAIGVSTLFASAFLSELRSENKIKISSMRVGSSPLYFIDGQEEKLENFVQHLGQREREAFSLLKEEKVLNDETQAPVVRVALRAIKDFAIPVKVRVGGDSKLFWKYFSVRDSEVGNYVTKNFVGSGGVEESGRAVDIKQNLGEQQVRESENRVGQDLENGEDTNEFSMRGQEVKSDKKEEVRENVEVKNEEVRKPKKAAKKEESSKFGISVRDYLAAKDVEVLEILSDKKKEFVGKVRNDGMFGKQEYYLIAKDKKNVSDDDLTLALQKAQGEKMVALVMTTGDLSKKAKEHLKEWRNLVKWERLNF